MFAERFDARPGHRDLFVGVPQLAPVREDRHGVVEAPAAGLSSGKVKIGERAGRAVALDSHLSDELPAVRVRPLAPVVVFDRLARAVEAEGSRKFGRVARGREGESMYL